MEDREELFRLYWDELMTYEEIADQCNISHVTVKRAMQRMNIPVRTHRQRIKLSNNGGRNLSSHSDPYWIIRTGDSGRIIYEHSTIMEKQLGRGLRKGERIHHKDKVTTNNHPLNLTLTDASGHWEFHRNNGLGRIPIYEVFMRMAVELSGRSTCIRARAGAVITSQDLTRVYGIGYNGPVSGWVHSCNGIQGQCGCIHAEENALLKAGSSDRDKVLFCTTSPCMNCAKKLIQSGFTDVFYRTKYRDSKPLTFLHYHNIRTCQYDKYKDRDWGR